MVMRACMYRMSPAFCRMPATAVTVGRVEPSIIARNSWLNPNSSARLRSYVITNRGDFNRRSVLHHGRDRTHSAVRKEHVANRVAAFQQHLLGGQRNSLEVWKDALKVLSRQGG